MDEIDPKLAHSILDPDNRGILYDEIEDALADNLHYCKVDGNVHKPHHFTLKKGVDSFYLLRLFKRFVTGKEKCRRCGHKIPTKNLKIAEFWHEIGQYI